MDLVGEALEVVFEDREVGVGVVAADLGPTTGLGPQRVDGVAEGHAVRFAFDQERGEADPVRPVAQVVLACSQQGLVAEVLFPLVDRGRCRVVVTGLLDRVDALLDRRRVRPGSTGASGRSGASPRSSSAPSTVISKSSPRTPWAMRPRISWTSPYSR
jgi:hypothetical protein